MTMQPTDEQLLEAFRAGDASALSPLLERYAPAVLRFGTKMCGDAHDGEDVLQETLLAAARGLAGFRGGASLRTWLFTIARSFCIKARRTSKFAPKRVESLEALVDGGALERGVAAQSSTGASIADATPYSAPYSAETRRPDEALATAELGAAIEAAIRALAPGYREVLVLRDVEGLSAAEVAEVLEIGVDAVKSRLHRARVEVRNRLLPLLVEGGEDAPAGASCPDVVNTFSRYLEGEIGPAECEVLDRHVSQCKRCSVACDSLRASVRACRAEPQGAVSPAVQSAVRAALRALSAEQATPSERQGRDTNRVKNKEAK
jgi:RNA polymerase sigma-70 factor (ECF subfamily)